MRSAKRLSRMVLAVGVLSAGIPLSAQDSRGGVGLIAFDQISVGTADRTDLARFTDAGVLVADGVSSLIVNIAGEMKGRAERDGAIGALLVPDVWPYDTAFRTRRVLLPAQEVVANVASGESSFFAGKQQRLDVGFARYRVLLYNTTGYSATVSVYVYRSAR